MKLYRDFKTQEDIDLQYNLALSVSDIDHWLNWYRQESEITRHELDCALDIQFGSTIDETIDIFPAKGKDSPVMVFIHGGYWVRCSSKDFSFVATGLVKRGISVVVINYSLCPKVTISEITRQNRAVVAWLYGNASEFNTDPSHIFAAGHSAGGQQVGMLFATDWEGDYGLPVDVIKGGISISGIFDLRPLRYSYLQPKLQLTNDIISQQSPCFNLSPSSPPLLITFGEEETEEFCRQSTEFFHQRQKIGLQGELLIQNGRHHFSTIKSFKEADSMFCEKVSDFIFQCE